VVAAPWLYCQFARSRQFASLRSAPEGFCALWTGWCLLFFSMSSCKLPTYILPALPALFLLLGTFLEQVISRASLDGIIQSARRWAPLSAAVVLCTALMAMALIAWLWDVQGGSRAVCQIVAGGAVLTAILLGRKRYSCGMAWTVCCLVAYGFAFESTHHLLPVWAASRSPISQSTDTAQMMHDPETAIVPYNRECGSVPFYLNRDDVQLFEASDVEGLSNCLKRRPRSLLIGSLHLTPQLVRTAVPEGMSLRKLCIAGRSSVWMRRNGATGHTDGQFNS
jgi:dolichol-phosphate mannosyltransferase